MFSTSGNVLVSAADKVSTQGDRFDHPMLILIPFLLRLSQLDPAAVDNLIALAQGKDRGISQSQKFVPL